LLMRRSALVLAVLALSCSDAENGDDDVVGDTHPLVPADTTDTAALPAPREAQVSLSDNPSMVLEKRFAITLSAGVPAATLHCTSPDDPLEDHRLPVTGGISEVRLFGILPDLSYTCTLDDELGSLWESGFDVAALPDGFPTFIVSGDAARATLDDGYTLFNHWKRGPGEDRLHRIMVIDSAARVRWYDTLLDAAVGGISARWLGNGQVLIGGGDKINPGLFDLSGDPLFQVADALTEEGYHHEALLTPDGWIVSLQGTDAYGPGGETFVGFRVEATDPATGIVEWGWDSQTAIDLGTLPVPTDGDYHPYHANAVSWVDDDPEGPSVWVSMRDLNVVARIDRATGDLTTMFGPDRGYALEDESGAPLPEEKWFWGLHAPEIEQGLVFTLFDNGASRPGGDKYSRAAMFRRDPSGTATLLWEWTEPGWYEPDFGSVRKTQANSVVIGSGHCIDCPPYDDNAWILEVDMATGDVLWRYDFTDGADTIYRAEAVDRCAFPNLRYCAEAGL